jgi:hypothetical protein
VWVACQSTGIAPSALASMLLAESSADLP